MDRRRLTHEEAANDLPAYVIGALDGDEADALTAHLATCAACQIEQARLEETLGLVGLTAPSVEAPPNLRTRVLGQLDTTPQVSIAATMTPEAPISIFTRLSRFGLAAAAILLVGAIIWAGLLRQDLQSTQNNLNLAMTRQTTDTELLANVSRMIPLVADNSPNAYGTLYIGSQSHRALLVVEELPPTPADHTYQVWLTNGTTRISAGLFTVNSAGSAMVMIDAPEPLTEYQSLGITSEPAPNGSSSPTSERMIGCSLR